jgi:hypothetical protein
VSVPSNPTIMRWNIARYLLRCGSRR